MKSCCHYLLLLLITVGMMALEDPACTKDKCAMCNMQGCVGCFGSSPVARDDGMSSCTGPEIIGCEIAMPGSCAVCKPTHAAKMISEYALTCEPKVAPFPEPDCISYTLQAAAEGD